jgi:diguanylate cyclase (GGDEF)-like protein/PAS domain S-box-containing protein
MSLRTRILMLVLLGVMLPAAAFVHYLVGHRDVRAAEARRALSSLAGAAATGLDARIRATSQMLYGLAHASNLDTQDRAACSEFLAKVLAEHPQYTGLLTILPDANLHCDSLRTARNLNLANRSYFKEALTSERPAFELVFGGLTGIAVLQVALASRDTGGNVKHVLLASINLDLFARDVLRNQPYPGMAVVVWDGKGTIMAMHPLPGDGEKLAGTPMADADIFRWLHTASDGATATHTGPGGASRVWAVAAPNADRGSGLSITIGVPEAELVAAADSELYKALTALAGTLLLVGAGALALAELGIRRPVTRIIGATGRFSAGDMSARIGKPYPRGELGHLMAALDGTSDRLQEQSDELFNEKERAQVTLNSIGDAVACTDIAGNLTFLNVVAEKMSGWSLQEAAGRPIAEIFPIVSATNRDPKSTVEAIQLPSSGILVRRDGSEVHVEDSVAPIRDRDGQATGAVIIIRDVSAAREMALQIAHSAEHDLLTGLPNRMLVNDRVAQAAAQAQRHMKKLAVLSLDLDGFKNINDSLGHSIGDKLLQSIAGRLIDCVRGGDTVSRQGGDEFVVLLSEVEHAEEAAMTARRMMQAIAAPHSIDQHDLHVTTSIGVSIYPEDGPDAETLIKNADTAMYQAKENGCQRYQFFKPAMNARAVERQSIEEGLRRAIERKELSLHYQPKINLKTGAISGAEALLRWNHPARGAVSPAQFIPVAEDCGLILPIGAWVLREACTQARAWADEGLPEMTMAVNVSAVEFRDDGFLAGVLAMLAETGLDPSLLELELTESVLMKRAAAAASILQALRAKGVQIAVDDFGTGYSSLSYLQKFPVDALKIDQSFIRQISAAGDDTTLVTAVIGMAHSLKLRVVAEGVETLQELTFLRANQCDEAQGYYFSRPVPPAEFAKLLETGIPAPAVAA